MSLDRIKWPRCLLWHGWLPRLSGTGEGDPWAASFVDLASFHLERCLGAYPVDLMCGLMLAGRTSLLLVGLRLLALVFICLLLSLLLITLFGERQRNMVMRCRAFMPVPGVMQTVQRAEFCCAIVAMQAYRPCHSGFDNLNVAGTVGRLLEDKSCLVKPLPLVKDGGLAALVQYMIRTRGRETVRVTKVKGHAEDVDVQLGRVRLVDQQGNDEG